MSRLDPQITEVRDYTSEIQDAAKEIIEITDLGDSAEIIDNISRIAELANQIDGTADSIDNTMNPIEQDADDMEDELDRFRDVDLGDIAQDLRAIDSYVSDLLYKVDR